MADTVKRLMEYYGPQSKIVIWAHNNHIGDARATSMRSKGLLNIDQIIQEEYADEDIPDRFWLF
ncbi:erythromycin esterase family protein [Algoriphagus resistens]|uniref:erythromycin esterase family protein n=1 Tax=Algoriphagus resistens TaxID=1750590 RepID=UPI0009EA7C72|nr:erythromycin esterase family protein [Algoriphagus resistens]